MSKGLISNSFLNPTNYHDLFGEIGPREVMELMKNKNVIGLLQLFQSSFHILMIPPLSYSILNSW